MQPVMTLRNKYRDAFQERHGVKLGFMSFFAKAACEALRRFPSVNAEIRGNNIVLPKYFDIGIAIGGGKGLVVSCAPKRRTNELRRDRKNHRRLCSQGDSQQAYARGLGGRNVHHLSKRWNLRIASLYTIVNPPQSGILGLHSIQERPICAQWSSSDSPHDVLALTYDHRIIDGGKL